MADQLPWFKCNAGEALESCMDMDPEEFGYYWRAILYMYARGGFAPFDEAKLRHIWNCSKQAARKWRDRLIEAGRFEKVGDNLTQSRVKKELRIARKIDAILADARDETSEKPTEKLEKTDDVFAEKRGENSAKTPDVFSDNRLKTNDLAKQSPEPREKDTKKDAYGVPEAVEDWNRTADELGLRKCIKVTDSRKRAIGARLKEFGEDGWKRALAQIGRHDWMLGNGSRNWKADLDYVAGPKGFTKLLESAPTAEPNPIAADMSPDAWAARVEAYRSNAGLWRRDWGPEPGQAGCRAPQEILEQHGFTEQGGQLRLVSGQ